jgi:hypothetical protein
VSRCDQHSGGREGYVAMAREGAGVVVGAGPMGLVLAAGLVLR